MKHPAPILDQSLPTFWRQVQPDMSALFAPDGKNLEAYTVTQVVDITENDGLANWLALELKPGPSSTEQVRWLVVKTVDQLMDVRIFKELIPAAARRELIESSPAFFADYGDTPPETPSGFAYAPEVQVEEKDGVPIVFGQKPPELFGPATLTPLPSGVEGQLMGGIAEYAAPEGIECVSPELFIFEVGPENSDEGGLIRVLNGRLTTSPDEVQIVLASNTSTVN